MPLVAQVVSGKAFDTDIALSRSEADAVVAAGYQAVCRYGPLPGNEPGWDFTAHELTNNTDAGLVVWMVQHPRRPENNILSDQTGQQDAEHLVTYAKLVGYVAPDRTCKITLTLDMEGVKNPGALTSFAHAKRWATVVLTAGYKVLIYLGYACGLTAAQCDALVALTATIPGCTADDVAFWCDAADPKERPAPTRGLAAKQHVQTTICGFGADPDDILQPVIFGLSKAPPEDVEPHGDPPGEPHINPTTP